MYIRNDQDQRVRAQKALERAAYEYAYTKARELRDLGHEPTLTEELRSLLFDEYEEHRGAGMDIEDILDACLSNFEEGFSDEAAAVTTGESGPQNPRERSRALYLIAEDVRERADHLRDELDALMAGPHGHWAAREREGFLAGRSVGDCPIELVPNSLTA